MLKFKAIDLESPKLINERKFHFYEKRLFLTVSDGYALISEWFLSS
jgi:hypothetical protein